MPLCGTSQVLKVGFNLMTTLTQEQRTELATKLHQLRPVDLNVSQNTDWTVSDLAVVVEQRYGVVYKALDGYPDPVILPQRC
jgi:hypothetical protein